MKAIFATLLLLLFGAASIEAIDALLPRAAGDVCTNNGATSCSDDCRDVQLCNNGVLSTFPCPEKTFCNPFNDTCTASTSCSPPPPEIECHGTGPFPDPYDCTKYHSCNGVSTQIPLVPVKSVPLKCSGSSAFDPLTFSCTKTLEDRVCVEKPIPFCADNFQKGPQRENPNIYYICYNKVPNLYKCNPGEVYRNNGCVRSTGTTTAIPESSTGTTSATTPSGSTTTPPATTTAGVTSTTMFPCTHAGAYLDPSDTSCRRYIICTASLVPHRRSCLSGYHYEVATRKCVVSEGCPK